MKSDLSYLQTGPRTVAKILVGLQIYKGLADKHPIELEGSVHVQHMDYEGLPFRCHRCHTLGHLVVQCTRSPRVLQMGAVSQFSTRNVAGTHTDVGDAISCTNRSVAVDVYFPPQSYPEACT